MNETLPKNKNGVHWVAMFDRNDEHAGTLVTTLKQSLTARNYTVGEEEAVSEDNPCILLHSRIRFLWSYRCMKVHRRLGLGFGFGLGIVGLVDHLVDSRIDHS